jgi:NADH:quinone reductase (non-electrogenic)
VNKPVKILILGGGFAGVYCALELEKRLPRTSAVAITLVNRDNFLLFTPMLHEVAASDVDVTHVVTPLRKLFKRTEVFDGDIEAIDLPARRVKVSHGIGSAHQHELEYDHLVLALGSTTNFYSLPGLEERALTMKSLGDALILRGRMIEFLEEADFECCAAVRGRLLTFVVAGGGFAGVETIAGINDFLRESLRFYRNLREEMLRLVLVHPGKVILPELGEKLGSYAQRKLTKRGVEILLNVTVTAVTDDQVTLSDGTTITAGTVIWTAGTSANPLLGSLPCEKEKGRVRVGGGLEVPGWQGVWALGDCAVVPDPETGMPYPPTAQHALREARTLARNILAALDGKPAEPFHFATIGMLAAIGRRTGVANIFGINFSGFVAWWLWRTIYLSKLPGLEKKLRVALDWTLDLIFSKDLVQFTSQRAPTISSIEKTRDHLLKDRPHIGA